MSNAKRGKKITTSHKITMGAVSILGLVGGWNLIAHSEEPKQIEAQQPVADGPAAVLGPATGGPATGGPTTGSPATPTPWPTIAPLGQMARLELAPLPTLAATMPPTPAFVSPGMSAGSQTTAIDLGASLNIAAMPTLAPLPTLPEYTAPPPPPPMPVMAAAAPPPAASGGGNNSQGS